MIGELPFKTAYLPEIFPREGAKKQRRNFVLPKNDQKDSGTSPAFKITILVKVARIELALTLHDNYNEDRYL